jgi:hypothetical protein
MRLFRIVDIVSSIVVTRTVSISSFMNSSLRSSKYVLDSEILRSSPAIGEPRKRRTETGAPLHAAASNITTSVSLHQHH